MTFEEWWKVLKPAECDEVKPYFEECWRISHDAALERAIQACKNVARKQGTIARQLAAMECGEVIGTLKESKE